MYLSEGPSKKASISAQLQYWNNYSAPEGYANPL